MLNKQQTLKQLAFMHEIRMNERGALHSLIYKRLCGHLLLEPNHFEFEGKLPIPKLIVAACNNDTEQIQDLIVAGHDLEIRELYTGKTPLMMAAAWGNLESVKKLIETGAKLNNTDVVGLSALDEAFFAGHQDVVACLREAGAQPELPFTMHPEVALLLREAGAQSKTIFAIAFLQKKTAKCQSDQEEPNQHIIAPKQGLQTLPLHVWEEDFKTGTIIEETTESDYRLVFVEVNDRSKFIKYYFRLFVFADSDVPIVAVSLETSSSLAPDFCIGKHIGQIHETLDIVACLPYEEFKSLAIKVFKETVGLLPQSNRPICDTNSTMQVLLELFKSQNTQQTVRNQQFPPAPPGMVPKLVLAAYENNIALVKSLIAAGHPLEMRDDTGKTALIMAARWGNFEIVKLLISCGADIDTTDTGGFSAIEEAATGKHSEIVTFLKSKGAKFDPAKLDRMGNGCLGLFTFFALSSTFLFLLLPFILCSIRL